MGLIFSRAAAMDSTPTKPSSHYESAGISSDDRFGRGSSQAQSGMDLRSIVQRQFMRMMDSHDRVRAQLLGASPSRSNIISGD